jgi:hypothetical protein
MKTNSTFNPDRIIMMFLRLTVAITIAAILHLNLTHNGSYAANAGMIIYLFIVIIGERFATVEYRKKQALITSLKQDCDDMLEDCRQMKEDLNDLNNLSELNKTVREHV